MLQRALKPTGQVLILCLATTVTASLTATSAHTGSKAAEEKTASAHLPSSSPPPRLLRLSANQGGVRHIVVHEFLSSIFLVIAVVVVFLVALCVIRCRCARVCPCLCGEEAALARAELVKEGRKRGRTVMIDEENEEDVLAEGGGKEGVVEGGAATVAGEEEEEAKEGGEEDRKEGGGRVKEEEEEESEASIPPSTPLKSLSSSLLALLGMNARGTPTTREGGGEEELRKTVEQEMARLQQEGGGKGGGEELSKKFELQMQRLQEREGGMVEESKEYRAVE